jgi:hypothetical protein
LIGNWARTNNGSEERTFEYWQDTENGIAGLGFTLVREDTVFKESLQIIEADKNLYYNVRGVNPDPTLFKFVEVSDTHFVCVNDSNEFPNRIEYRFQVDSMTMIISANDKMIEFRFKRMK